MSQIRFEKKHIGVLEDPSVLQAKITALVRESLLPIYPRSWLEKLLANKDKPKREAP